MGDLREHDLEVRGLRLRVREQGPPGAPACLLLHGWLDQGGAFDLLAPLLVEQGVRTLALDLRGHGESAWVGPGGFYHLADYVADLDGVLDALGLALPGSGGRPPPQPVRLCGHSLGATVSLLFAAVRPGRVAHLALLDGMPLKVQPAEVPGRLSAYLEDLKLPRLRRRVASMEQAAERVRKANPGISAQAALHLARAGISPDPAQGGALAWKWDPWLRAHSPLPLLEAAFHEVIAGVVAPALIVRAGSTWLPEERELRKQFGRMPGAISVATIRGTHHHLHLEAPEAVAAEIAAAWRRLA